MPRDREEAGSPHAQDSGAGAVIGWRDGVVAGVVGAGDPKISIDKKLDVVNPRAAMSRNIRALTLREVTDLLCTLSGQTVTERQVRYLLITGQVGADATTRAHGRTRLYGSLDVALARAALGLRAEGVSPQLTRVVITYLRDDLVRAWRAAAPLAVAITGVQGSLEPVSKGRPGRASAWVPLRALWQGLEARVQEVADGRDDVWMYRKVRVSAVPRNTV